MKQLLLFIFHFILSTGMVSAQVKTLVYTDHEPLGNMRTRFINEVFFPAIEKESNGRLKIEAHWNGELSISYDALRKVSGKGVADMGIVVPEYTPNELPLHQIFKSFPVGPAGGLQVEFFQRVYSALPVFQQELEQANIVNLLFTTGYPTAFFSIQPLNSLKEIKGGQWRSASFWHKDFLRNAGGIPITIPWGEGVYKALQSGSLDGVMVNIDSGYDINLHKVAPHILLSENLWLGHIYLLVINKQSWESLGKEDQASIQRAAFIAYTTLGLIMNNSLEELINTLEESGATVRILKQEEQKQWENLSKYKDVQAGWVKEQENKGVKDVGSTMNKVSIIMNETIK